MMLWNSTPKRINALHFIARRRDKKNIKDRLVIISAAFRAKPEELSKAIRDLSRDP